MSEDMCRMRCVCPDARVFCVTERMGRAAQAKAHCVHRRALGVRDRVQKQARA